MFTVLKMILFEKYVLRFPPVFDRNCEDIAMSFLVANVTGAPPVWVQGLYLRTRKKFNAFYSKTCMTFFTWLDHTNFSRSSHLLSVLLNSIFWGITIDARFYLWQQNVSRLSILILACIFYQPNGLSAETGIYCPYSAMLLPAYSSVELLNWLCSQEGFS